MKNLVEAKRTAVSTPFLYLLLGVFEVAANGNPVGLSQPSGLQASLSGADITLSGAAGTATAGQTLSSGNTSCAIDNTGAAWCWGPSYDGELGNGSTSTVTGGAQFGASYVAYKGQPQAFSGPWALPRGATFALTATPPAGNSSLGFTVRVLCHLQRAE